MLQKHAFQHNCGAPKVLKTRIFMCQLFKIQFKYITFAK